MHIIPKMNKGESYLARFPKLDRWMSRCIACGRQGYKPELPDQIYRWPSAHAAHLRAYFEPMEVDGEGLCEQCQTAKKKSNRDIP
jgi:hypothetical protein